MYPAHLEKGGPLITARTLIVPDGIHFLYKHLIDAGQIVEINNYDKEKLEILPWNVIESIKAGSKDWENSIPETLVTLIKQKSLLNYGG